MTGAVSMRFKARTLSEAREEATKQWRQLSESPDAELPPMTHLLMVSGEADYYDVTVSIDIDRVQVEKTQSA